MEEIDLCWRLQNLGYTLKVLPASVVFHVGGGTLPNENPRKIYLNFRNNLALLFKNLAPADLYVLPLRMMLDGLAAANFLREGKWRFAWAVLMAHLAFYKWIPRLIVWRRRTYARKRLNGLSTVMQHSMLTGFYLHKHTTFNQLFPTKPGA